MDQEKILDKIDKLLEKIDKLISELEESKRVNPHDVCPTSSNIPTLENDGTSNLNTRLRKYKPPGYF